MQAVAVALALSVTGLTADTAPIDTLYLSVTTDPTKVFGPIATLSVTRDGVVSYSHATQPHTGSGGKITKKEWKIPPKEAAAVLDGAVADGLLGLPAGGKAKGHYYAHVTRGRWEMTLHLNDRPDEVIKRVLPLLQSAHPEEWGTPVKAK